VAGEQDLRRALVLSYASVAWSAVAGTASIIAGVQASSTALVGTGADVLADLISSVVLVWRFRAELHGARLGHDVDRRAHRVAALALLAVAAGVAAASAIRLVQGHGASAQVAGIVIASVSVAVLPLFVIAKVRVARAVGSPALRTDGVVTMVGACTAALSLLGLLLTKSFGWTAADPVAALGVALLAGVTGWRELRAARH
jgi:divalent metal cation (Fe/Co/Zn/Cd) transporter